MNIKTPSFSTKYHAKNIIFPSKTRGKNITIFLKILRQKRQVLLFFFKNITVRTSRFASKYHTIR
eukprot:UN08419